MRAMSGAGFQRLRVSYWVAKSDEGWRILTFAAHG